MKPFDFVVTLKRPDYKNIDRISFFMLLFAVIVFIYTAIHNNSMLQIDLVFSLVIILSVIIAMFFYKKKSAKYFTVSLLLAAIAWFFQPQWNIFFGMIYLIAALLERQAKFPLEIGVDKNGIVFNSFPKKKSAWNELNNVLIKDGVLTVDFKNNKLYQKDIEENISDELEKEFNEFCRKKLDDR